MAEVTRTNRKAFIEIGERLKHLDEYEARAGWFASSIYEKGSVPVAYVASIHEFGVPEKNIPPRPFMRPTITEQQKAWFNLGAEGAKAIIAGRYNAQEVMTLIGSKMAADVAKTITRIWTPELKKATVKARARSYASNKGLITESLTKPLIASGKLYGEIFNDTINHQVVKAGTE